MAALANFLVTKSVWTMSGPFDILPFCGQHGGGKALVMKLLGRDSPTLLLKLALIAKTMLVDGDRAAVLGQAHGDKACEQTSDQLSHRQFIQFREREGC